MTEKQIPRLAIHTPVDLFDKLKWELNRLQNGWGIYDSFNFIVTAHHLYYDWIDEGKAASAEQVERKNALPQDAKDVFQAIVDVSNSCKHWHLTNPGSLKRQVVLEVAEPSIASLDAYVWGPMVYFDFKGHYVSMSEMSALVMTYLEWIINGGDDAVLDEMSSALKGMKVE
nr:hypothetical protein [uncultured Massilia sp.]